MENPVVPKGRNRARRQRGTALVTVMFIVMVVGVGAGSLGLMVSRDVHKCRGVVDRLKAQEVATGALGRALGILAGDVSQIASPSAEMTNGTLGDGTFNLTVAEDEDDSAIYCLAATGTVGDQSQNVKVYVRLPESAGSFLKGLFADKDINAGGGGSCDGQVQNNGTHSNGATDFGGHVSVDGVASAVGTVTASNNVTLKSGSTPNVARIAFPKLDFDYYYSIAAAHSEVVGAEGTTTNLSGTYTPAGGVLWVVGDARISSHTTINGALFLTGNLHQAGHLQVFPPDNTYPAIALPQRLPRTQRLDPHQDRNHHRRQVGRRARLQQRRHAQAGQVWQPSLQEGKDHRHDRHHGGRVGGVRHQRPRLHRRRGHHHRGLAPHRRRGLRRQRHQVHRQLGRGLLRRAGPRHQTQ
ncbi:MAG: hypothetical protein BWZ02_00912 [Lentisphaerae bacterium ADurb.BinA184]|nr:MAG: hypothetical protein BWZ02_00912 [Lentisphaerae bacterium ADurb.BinA184]